MEEVEEEVGEVEVVQVQVPFSQEGGEEVGVVEVKDPSEGRVEGVVRMGVDECTCRCRWNHSFSPTLRKKPFDKASSFKLRFGCRPGTVGPSL